MTSVLLAGGGSAGHISPLLATADALRRQDPNITITVLGTQEGLESRLVPARGYDLRTIPKVPLPRRLNRDLLAVPGKLADAVTAVNRILLEVRADAVVGMGGYVCPPAYLAARRGRVPIVVHEQNARAGIANKLGARLSKSVATAFDGTRLPHAVRIGMPLRTEITELGTLTPQARAERRAQARSELGLDPDTPTLLVTGGSLGAQRLNEAMEQVMPDLADGGIQVLHLTGAGKGEPVLTAVRAANVTDHYHVREYLDRMELGYAAADLVICRSGANTVSELTCVGLPAVYVPLAIGNGEQRLNAEPVVKAGGGLIIPNDEINAEAVRAQVLPLLRDGDARDRMANAAAAFGVTDADDRLAQMVLEACR